mgnify:FL=1
MTEITSNITFDNNDGQITKCVLQIGEKTFTVTLVKGGYEVKEEGNVTLSPSSGSDSSSSSGSDSSSSSGSLNPGSNSSTSGAASTTANADASALPQSGQEKEYNTQEELIKTLGPYGYKPQ